MTVLVITGGIGSGKSEVCRILKDMGISAQYDADSRAKALYLDHPTLLSDIEDRLGESFRDEEGRFVPSLLAGRIFTDADALATVEELLFPVMLDDFNRFAGECGEDIVVFESATILEKPQFEGFGDKVILVDAPFEVRLGRACARDRASEDAILARMSRQRLMNELSDGLKDPRVDYVISNNGTYDDLKTSITEILKTLQNENRS